MKSPLPNILRGGFATVFVVVFLVLLLLAERDQGLGESLAAMPQRIEYFQYPEPSAGMGLFTYLRRQLKSYPAKTYIEALTSANK